MSGKVLTLKLPRRDVDLITDLLEMNNLCVIPIEAMPNGDVCASIDVIIDDQQLDDLPDDVCTDCGGHKEPPEPKDEGGN